MDLEVQQMTTKEIGYWGAMERAKSTRLWLKRLRIPSNDSVVQDRQTTERVDLIAELASPQRALLAKAEESRQVVRSLTFVKFAAHSSAIFLVIQSS